MEVFNPCFAHWNRFFLTHKPRAAANKVYSNWLSEVWNWPRTKNGSEAGVQVITQQNRRYSITHAVSLDTKLLSLLSCIVFLTMHSVHVNNNIVYFSVFEWNAQNKSKFVHGWFRGKVNDWSQKRWGTRYSGLLLNQDQNLQTNTQCTCTEDKNQNFTKCFARL